MWNKFFQIKEYLKNELDLDVKENYQVFPVDSRGIDFVGYRHFRGYKLLRKSTLHSCKVIAKKIEERQRTKSIPTEKEWCGWVSSLGWLTWCDSTKIYCKYYVNNIPIINTYYTINKRGKHRRFNH